MLERVTLWNIIFVLGSWIVTSHSGFAEEAPPYEDGIERTLVNLKMVAHAQLPKGLGEEIATYAEINPKKLKGPDQERSLCLAYVYRMWETFADRALDPKSRYNKVLANLRKAIDSDHYRKWRYDPSAKSEIGYLQKLGAAIHLGNDLHEWQKDLPKNIISSGLGADRYQQRPAWNHEDTPASVQRALGHLTDVYKTVAVAGRKTGYSRLRRYYMTYQGGVTWMKFDPAMHGSLISLKMRFVPKPNRNGRSSDLHFVRMSTPTIGSDRHAKIAGEFIAYLDWLKLRGLSHTYVNFQDSRTDASKDVADWYDRMKLFGINNESYRARALADLERTYPGTFHLITLSRNNSFYKQRRRFSKMDQFSSFSAAFVDELLSNDDNGFYAPKVWRDQPEKMRGRLQNFMTKLQGFLFDGKSHLTKKERLLFIEVAYFYIAMMAAQDAYSVNLTCKDGIDRAGAAHGLAFVAAMGHEWAKGASSSRMQQLAEYLEGVIYADALTVKHRALIKSRLTRFVDASLLFMNRIGSKKGYDELEPFMPFSRVEFGVRPKEESSQQI